MDRRHKRSNTCDGTEVVKVNLPEKHRSNSLSAAGSFFNWENKKIDLNKLSLLQQQQALEEVVDPTSPRVPLSPPRVPLSPRGLLHHEKVEVTTATTTTLG